MYGPVPGGSGEVWEIKEYDWLSPISSQADVVEGIAQLAGYVALLNACCVSVTNGNCGKGTFGYWVNTVNPFRCGKVLGWIVAALSCTLGSFSGEGTGCFCCDCGRICAGTNASRCPLRTCCGLR